MFVMSSEHETSQTVPRIELKRFHVSVVLKEWPSCCVGAKVSKLERVPSVVILAKYVVNCDACRVKYACLVREVGL